MSPERTRLGMEAFELPQQLSLLYGGKIAPHFGAFAQVTYDFAANTFNIDNTDFRFANTVVLPNKTAVRLRRVDQQQPDDRGPVEYDSGVRLPVCSAGGHRAVTGDRPIINAGTAYEVAGPVGYILWNEQVVRGARLLPSREEWGEFARQSDHRRRRRRLIQRPLA